MERRYDRRIADGYAAMERTNFYDAIYSPVVLLLNAVVVGIVMLLSASGNAEILRLFGMSVGTSVAVISYISRIFAPIESLGMEIQTIQSAMAGVRRIDAFLAQPERAVPKRNETAARGDVALSHVTFGYGEKPVLRDFSMTVRQGEQVTLVGRTGAGKSTVFKLLLGLYQPEAGTDHHRRRGRFQNFGSGATDLHWLRGAAFFPRAGDGAGPDHAGRPADHGGDGEKRGAAGRYRRRHAGACRRAMIRCARRGCSRRASGSCCPLPALRRQTRLCCCWTRLRQTWMPKPKRAFWRRCAVRLRGARFFPFRTASMKIWVGGRSRPSRRGNEMKFQGETAQAMTGGSRQSLPVTEKNRPPDSY